MQSLIDSVESKYKKKQVVDVRSGDTVRVHQKITEGDKTRTQVFEGVVIKTSKKNSPTNRIWVRRISSGVGVEKSFLMHSPLVEKVEVVKRSKVRRNNLSYMRTRAGKSARLMGVDFDADAVNTIEEQQEEAEVVPGAPEEEKKEDSEDKEESKEDTEAESKDESKADAKSEDSTKQEAKDEKSEEKPEPKKVETKDSESKSNTKSEDSGAEKKPKASKEDSKESKDKK